MPREYDKDFYRFENFDGRKPKMTESKIESAKKLLSSGVLAKYVAKNLGVSVHTLYRWVPASAQA
jgi:DNA invertase Pin-like site-specific DNA recombinase